MLVALPPARYRGGPSRQLRSEPANWSATELAPPPLSGAPADPASSWALNRHQNSANVHPRGRATHGEDAQTGVQVDGDGLEQ
eukprot:2205008-Pyramimonas_sp.AAC.1